MDDDSFFVILSVVGVGLVVVMLTVVLVKSSPPLLHTDVLPTEITKAVEKPPLAQTKLLTQKLVNLATAKAETYWGGTRCASIRYDYRPLPGRQIAQATWYTTSDQATVYQDCSVTFNTDPTKVKVSFYHYCAALIHEYGHLAGFHENGGLDNGSHSANPNNLMYPILREANIPKTCKVRVYVQGLRY